MTSASLRPAPAAGALLAVLATAFLPGVAHAADEVAAAGAGDGGPEIVVEGERLKDANPDESQKIGRGSSGAGVRLE